MYISEAAEEHVVGDPLLDGYAAWWLVFQAEGQEEGSGTNILKDDVVKLSPLDFLVFTHAEVREIVKLSSHRRGSDVYALVAVGYSERWLRSDGIALELKVGRHVTTFSGVFNLPLHLLKGHRIYHLAVAVLAAGRVRALRGGVFGGGTLQT